MSHQLRMKIEAQVMIMRNLNQTQKLCNGTKMMVTQLGNMILKSEIMTGT